MKKLLVLLMLTACTAKEGVVTQQESVAQDPDGLLLNSSRFKVYRESTFVDRTAYDNKRSLYVIKDTRTGQEFIGLSGVGVAELGSHRSGKITGEDER